MKKVYFLLIFLFLVFQLKAQTQSSYIPSGYSLVFNDEFDSASSKTAKWTGDDRNGRDIEWNQNAIIEDGVLKLKNIRLPSVQPDGREFTAPSGHTLMSFKYGYFECRYKYAASTGFNNSFWLLANSPPLDANYMEIDINEGVLDEGGNRERKVGLIDPTFDQVRPLILDHTRGSGSRAAYYYTADDLSAEFHVYGFEWTPDSLIIYYDGQRLLAQPNSSASSQSGYRWVNYPMQVYLSSFNSAGYPKFDQAVNSEMVVDYVRVYQKPSQIGLPPTTGNNLIKFGDFPPYNSADYGSGLKYTWNTIGNVNDGFLRVNSSTARTSPLFMPQQFINVPTTGIYDVSFKARIVDSNNSSSIGLKISDNTTGYVNSIITSATPLTSGATLSSMDMRVNASANTATWKTYVYRVRLQPNANAADCRIGFYLTNTQVPAVFEIDDISLVPVTESTTIIKDGAFNYDFREGSAAGLTDIQWTALANWTKSGDPSINSTTQIIEESSNRYIRKVVSSNNNDFQIHISQFSGRTVPSGRYRLKFKSKTDVASSAKFIRVLLSAESAQTTNVITSTSSASSNVSFVSGTAGHLNITPSVSWTESSVDVDLTMPVSNLLRISFRFLQSGTFDIDDVSLEPINTLPLTLVSFNASSIKNNVNLKWETISESNVSHFDLQSSFNGKDFKSLAKITAAGNTTNKTVYTYNDLRLLPVNSDVYYRLNCVDHDGSSKYSDIVAVQVKGLNTDGIKVYPTVVESLLNIDLSQYDKRLPLSYKIYNITGLKVFEGTLNKVKELINLELLAPGIYTISFQNNSNIKFIKK